MVAVRRCLLQEAALFPLGREILELARVLIAPGTTLERADPTRCISRRRQWRKDER
jgi:hypothetical protein